MSIINDALKKASRNKQEFASYQSQKSGYPTIELQRKKHWEPILAFLILLLIAGPVVAPLFSTPLKKTGVPQLKPLEATNNEIAAPAKILSARPAAEITAAPETASVNQKSQFIIEELPRPLPLPPPALVAPIRPSFTLKGIVMSNDQSYCIINDRVVKKGSTISGAKLSSIEPDKVVLDYNNETITLTVAG